MAANAIKAGEAFLTLSVRDKGFAAGLQRSLGKLRATGIAMAGIGARISAAGGLLSAPFAAAAKVFADFGSNLFDMSKRTRFSVEALSELWHAAEQSGASASAVETAVGKMARTIDAAGDGSESAVNTLNRLGLTFEELKGKSPAEAFRVISQRIAETPDDIAKMSLAMAVFGKSGRSLLPMIEDFQALSEEFKHFNLEVSTEAAARADVLGDVFGLVRAVIRRLGFEVGDSLSKPLTAAGRIIAEVTAKSILWVRANQGLVIAVASIGGAVIAAGAAFTAFGLSLAITGVALSGIVGFVSALLSPVALVAAGIGVATAAFLRFTSIGQALSRFLATRFVALFDVAKETFGGIANALAAGDIQAAADVLWAGLKVAWLEGTKELSDAWVNFKDQFLRTTTNLIFDAQGYWADFSAAVKTIWNEMVTAARITGEEIGHWLSRSDDPATAADQDAAHNVALNQIKNEGTAKRAEIEENRQKELAAIKETSATAEADRNSAHTKELKRLKDELAEAKHKFKAATAAAAVAAKLPGGLGGFEDALGSIGGTASGIKSRTLFGGRLAEQTFGFATKGDPVPRQQLLEARKANRLLEKIERKKGFDLRVGNS